MKIGVVGDIHFSQYSSIVRSRGDKFSTRLENCIQSINWAESIMDKLGCKIKVYLGDLFDRSDLNSEEISALRSVSWYPSQDRYFLVGNHEMGNADLSFNSAFSIHHIGKVIDINSTLDYGDIELCMLPYVLEENRKCISDYFNKKYKKRIIFSHNDIKGIQMGQFISNAGFNIGDIEDNCDLFINGHLHNGSKVTNKIFNVGNLTGQNFSEDAYKYDHCIYIIDTDTLQIDLYENPYAFNFYKLDETNADLNKLKNNSVITLKCKEEDIQLYRDKIKNSDKIIESRLVVEYTRVVDSEISTEELSVDSLQEFKKFILDTLGSSDIIKEELQEICR